MARKIRVFIKHIPHIIHIDSLKELELFRDSEDYELFLSLLLVLSKQNSLEIHSYLLMPKFIEILATPKEVDSIPKFIQTLGRRYVAFYNKKYGRRGSLFNGRYKLSIVEAKRYLFEVMVYIESHPKHPKRYKYSSLQKNLFNKRDDIVKFHNLYRQLGVTDKERILKYEKIFSLSLTKQKSAFIKECIDKQLIVGDKGFINSLEKEIGAKLQRRRRGRPPKKNKKERKGMYKNLVVLDKEKHKDLKIKPMEDLEFAKDVSFVPLLANEVERVGKIFPVVFSNDDEPSVIAIVSLGGKSLALDNQYRWIGDYIPMALRRYPFSIASIKEDSSQKVILIDEDSHLLSTTEGESLFDDEGNATEALNRAINFLENYDKQMQITKNVAKLIKESKILDEREISVGEGEEKHVLIKGFSVVEREKLNGLSDDILAEWVRKGIINMIEYHIKSLNNIQNLFNILQQLQK